MTHKRKLLQETEEPSILKYATFFSRNKWRIVAGISLVVAVVLVIGIVQAIRKRNEANAFEAHRKAATPQDYTRVGEDFPGTLYGSLSLIEAGNLLFQKQNFAQARKLYLRFLDSYPESPLRAWAYNLAGATFEAEEKYDQAIQQYRRAEASAWLKLQARLNIGRCYELKGDSQSEKDPQLALQQYDVARTYYRQLTGTDSSPSRSAAAVSPWKSQAQSRMDFLTEKERKTRQALSEKKVDKDNR